jgi:hypothetical protein
LSDAGAPDRAGRQPLSKVILAVQGGCPRVADSKTRVVAGLSKGTKVDRGVKPHKTQIYSSPLAFGREDKTRRGVCPRTARFSSKSLYTLGHLGHLGQASKSASFEVGLPLDAPWTAEHYPWTKQPEPRRSNSPGWKSRSCRGAGAAGGTTDQDRAAIHPAGTDPAEVLKAVGVTFPAVSPIRPYRPRWVPLGFPTF